AADREHDRAVDLLRPPRDRSDEARRRDELVRARPVHARGCPVRDRWSARRRDPPDPRQVDRAAVAAPHRAAERRQRREGARVRAECADSDRHRAAARRGRLGPHDSPLPAGLSERAVVQVEKRGKLVVGEPYFVPGVPLTLDRKGLRDAGPGDLAVVRTGRGRASLERVLGKAKDIEVVLEGLLVHTGARVDRYEPYTEPETTGERVDVRDLLTFTIDPEMAKDFDDALSVVEEDGGDRAWVHIADVSAYVMPGTPLDRRAAERSFTTYV